MLAAAWEYAEDPTNMPLPRWIVLKNRILTYGVEAVMGRPVLGAKEINYMETCERVILAHQARQASENWAAWASDNPAANLLLTVAAKAANNGE
jgi:hypothetical protein